mmetsp:Transcript_1040/g.997  ORF Transcript_1040/g.997 Transcript_1040/m.997 type:complete len:414 (-) Transcript_1040:51-1292(-)
MAGDCFLLNEIAHKRREWRFDNGSISVENPEYYFELNEDSLPTQFSEQKRIQSKELVEEYMLLANLMVAEFLVDVCRDKAVLRGQLPPKEERVVDMIEYFEKVKADVDISSSLTTQKSFEKLKNSSNTALYYCCMRKYFSNIREANYITRGTEDITQVRHHSLNFDLYTHFTSPIRRYPDLLVHRQLTLALEHKEHTREIMENIDYKTYVAYCSDRYLTAKYASSTCTKLYHCIFLKNTQTQEGVDAYVYDMTSKSISFYIASINVNYKMDFRRDPRISSYYVVDNYTAYILFKSEEDLTLEEEEKETFADHGYDFKNIETPEEFAELRAKIEADDKVKDKLMKIEILEVHKLAVGTTNEIPIDLKCLIYRSDKDFERVKQIKEEEDFDGPKEGKGGRDGKDFKKRFKKPKHN